MDISPFCVSILLPSLFLIRNRGDSIFVPQTSAYIWLISRTDQSKYSLSHWYDATAGMRISLCSRLTTYRLVMRTLLVEVDLFPVLLRNPSGRCKVWYQNVLPMRQWLLRNGTALHAVEALDSVWSGPEV